MAWWASAVWLPGALGTVGPLVGRWFYHANDLVSFNADGTATHIGGGDNGTWEYVYNSEVQRHYRINWEHDRYVDSLVLSENEQKARVHNEASDRGDRYEVRRVLD